MHNLASFVMRGPWQAALVAAALAVLSLLLPPVLLLSGAAVALVTLRLGLQQGLLVLAIATVGGGLLAWLALGAATSVVWLALLYWVPLVILAMALRLSISLAATLRYAAILGAVAVAGFYLVLGDPAAWWNAVVQDIIGKLGEAGVADENTLSQFAKLFAAWAPLFPGQVVSSMLGSLLIALLLARWWQALLYNPGGFASEFYELRLGKPFALAMIVLLVLSLLWAVPFIVNLTLVLGVIYVLQGVAVVHALVAKIGLSKVWLVGFYLLLLIALLQLVMVLGTLDAWVDFRSRIKPGTKKNS